jgi:hypothetical protein
LLTGADPAGAAFIELKKAGAILLQAPIASPPAAAGPPPAPATPGTLAGGSRLLWLATPKILRVMAGQR